jgi:hypothetical protein
MHPSPDIHFVFRQPPLQLQTYLHFIAAAMSKPVAKGRPIALLQLMRMPPDSLQLDLRDPVPKWLADSDATAWLDRFPFGGLHGELVIQIPQLDPYFNAPFVIKISDTRPTWTVRHILSEIQKQFMIEAPHDQHILHGILPIRDARRRRLLCFRPPNPTALLIFLGGTCFLTV